MPPWSRYRDQRGGSRPETKNRPSALPTAHRRHECRGRHRCQGRCSHHGRHGRQGRNESYQGLGRLARARTYAQIPSMDGLQMELNRLFPKGSWQIVCRSHTETCTPSVFPRQSHLSTNREKADSATQRQSPNTTRGTLLLDPFLGLPPLSTAAPNTARLSVRQKLRSRRVGHVAAADRQAPTTSWGMADSHRNHAETFTLTVIPKQSFT